METQQDYKARIVALTNLRAMCDRVSGMAHRYSVVKVTRYSVHVEYSNPNEYGSPRPMTMILRAFPSDWPGDSENPRVILEVGRVLHDTEDGEGWQSFDTLLSCPTLWRCSPNSNEWVTREEIQAAQTA